jgi:hypothetical protein
MMHAKVIFQEIFRRKIKCSLYSGKYDNSDLITGRWNVSKLKNTANSVHELCIRSGDTAIVHELVKIQTEVPQQGLGLRKLRFKESSVKNCGIDSNWIHSVGTWGTPRPDPASISKHQALQGKSHEEGIKRGAGSFRKWFPHFTNPHIPSSYYIYPCPHYPFWKRPTFAYIGATIFKRIRRK